MWVAKVKIDGSQALLGKRAKKYNVSVSGYLLSSHESANQIYRYFASFLFGEPSNIRKFIHDFRKDKRVVNVEYAPNFIIAQIIEPLVFRPIHNHRIIHLEPVFIRNDGMEFWTIASWNKKQIMDFIKVYERTHQGELLWIGQKKIHDVSILSFQPSLSRQQQKAFNLALEKGYYEHPRQITLDRLAKIMGVSYSTYQAHLQCAESRLLPFFFRRGGNLVNPLDYSAHPTLIANKSHLI